MGTAFYWKSPEGGGGFPGRWGGVEWPGVCLWELFGGGGAKYFFSGPKFPPRRVISPAPGESDPQGSASSAGAMDAPLSRSFVCFCVCCRVTGALGRVASWTSCWEGARVAPSGPFFHTHIFPFPRSLFASVSLSFSALFCTVQEGEVLSVFPTSVFGRVLPLPLRRLLRDAFPRKFSLANFWFRALVSSRCVFWCCFAYVFALPCWNILPKVS